MKKQITRISVIQTSKVVALMYALISLLYTVMGLFMVIFGSGAIRAAGILYVLMPIIMVTFGFLFMMLFCWIYNVVAGWVGGVEFTVEEK
jgi:hypothetical protein